MKRTPTGVLILVLGLGVVSACGPGPQRNYTGYSRYAGEAGARAYSRSLDR